MKSWKYPYEVQTVKIDESVEIAYIDEGRGDVTLLFIHGLGSNLQAWQKNVETLKESHRCVAIDLPGYGKSSKKDQSYSMTFFASYVSKFIDELDLENVVVVGHSMGGQVSAHLANMGHEQLKGLILLSPAGFERFTEQESQWIKGIYTADFIKNTTEEQIVKNFEINFYEMPDDARFMIEDRLVMRADEQAYNQYCNMIPKCMAGMLDEPVFDLLPTIELPVLVVYGANDALIPNKYLHPNLTTEIVATSGCEQIKNCTMTMVDEAGHFANWEQSGAVNDAIDNFLATKF